VTTTRLSILAAMALLLAGCFRNPGPSTIIGTWLVHDREHSFPMHLYVFNADGTLQQSSPDAGDSEHSASDGKGIWAAEGPRIRGKWVDIMADRTTHQFTGRGEYTFDVSVSGNVMRGHATMTLIDPKGHATAVVPTTIIGERVTLR
jgi:hypothetical protein